VERKKARITLEKAVCFEKIPEKSCRSREGRKASYKRSKMAEKFWHSKNGTTKTGGRDASKKRPEPKRQPSEASISLW